MLGSAYGKGQVMMVAYNIEAEKAYGIFIGQFKSAGQDILPIPEDLKQDSVMHIYLAFIAADAIQYHSALFNNHERDDLLNDS